MRLDLFLLCMLLRSPLALRLCTLYVEERLSEQVQHPANGTGSLLSSEREKKRVRARQSRHGEKERKKS